MSVAALGPRRTRALPSTNKKGGLVHPSEIDWVIMGVYFAFVLGIGFALRRYMKTSTDYFLSGRSIPAWVAGLAFMAANLGAQEVIGMAASGAKYGMATSHFYWVGAIPAMVFLAIFMMPFYYGSRARSVPEYLRLRFDEKTRAFNAVSFTFMTVISSGISMYAMGLLLNLLLGWSFSVSMWVCAGVVLAYVFLGGLTSAIYNEVLQFFLIVQRAMAAESLSAARRTPLIATLPKMLFPFLVIVPGMIAIALTQNTGPHGFEIPSKSDGTPNFDLVIPMMLVRYFPNGLLG